MSKVKLFAIEIHPVGFKWNVTLNGASAGRYYLLSSAKHAAIDLGHAVTRAKLVPEESIPKGAILP